MSDARALEAFEEMIRADPLRGLLPDIFLQKMTRSYDESNPEFMDKLVDHDWQMFLKGWTARSEQ